MGYRLPPGMALGLGLLCWIGMLHAEPPASVDYLLLKNGSVLTGKVIQEGNTYIIRSKNSSGESRYPAAMVAKVCSGPAEAYAFLKKCSIPDDANEHCRLAQFCLTHNLFPEAKLEITAALQANPRSHQAQALAHQWHTRQNKTTTTSPEVPALPGEAVLPMPPVKLEDWPVMLTPQATQDFAFRIQPILLSGCGTGACHGGAEGKRAFVLKRGLAGVPASPAMTRYNLEHVLALVDENKPDSSELLLRAFQPHGSIKHWPVSKDQFAVLRQWVHFAAGKPQQSAQAEPSQSGLQQKAEKPKNSFASLDDKSEPDSNVLQASERTSESALPKIPGISGAAIQQVGGKESAPATNKMPAVETQQENRSSSGLPSIPGVSGKGQSENKPPIQQTPPEKPGKSPSNELQAQAAYQEYLKQLGIVPPIPEPTTEVPQRMHIVNAGTYQKNIIPPLPTFSDEVLEQLNRVENARKAPASKEPANKAGFLNSGTVVNQPPR